MPRRVPDCCIVRAGGRPYQAANKAADAAAGVTDSNGAAMSVLATTGAVASRSVKAAIVDTYRDLVLAYRTGATPSHSRTAES